MQQLFNQEKTKHGHDSQIRDKKKMKDLIEGRIKEKRFKNLNLDPADQTRVAIQQLRETIGALTYMQDEKVAKIFADQKNKMGAIFGHIDRELHKTSRVYKGDVEGHP
jgi:CRP-like cAMP-binding protein